AIKDPYTLALVCNALYAMKAGDAALSPYLARLEALKRTSDDGKQTWWEQGESQYTTFYGQGRSGAVETTAMATLALIESKQFPASTRGALTWIAGQKDANGTWHSTQATVLALKALLAGTGANLGGDKERRIDVVVGQTKLPQIVITADQSD